MVKASRRVLSHIFFLENLTCLWSCNRPDLDNSHNLESNRSFWPCRFGPGSIHVISPDLVVFSCF